MFEACWAGSEAFWRLEGDIIRLRGNVTFSCAPTSADGPMALAVNNPGLVNPDPDNQARATVYYPEGHGGLYLTEHRPVLRPRGRRAEHGSGSTGRPTGSRTNGGGGDTWGSPVGDWGWHAKTDVQDFGPPVHVNNMPDNDVICKDNADPASGHQDADRRPRWV